MRTVMKNKVFTRLMTALLLAVTVILAAYPSVAYAQVDEKEAAQETLKEEPKKPVQQAFCYLKGLVDCEPCDVQDCNIKRVRECPRNK